MEISEAGKAFIKAREELNLEPHWDAIGKVWDIGWGHVFKKGEREALIRDHGGRITREEAEALFDVDALYYGDHVSELVDAPLTQGMFDALASLLYNIGHENFEPSSVRRFLNNVNALNEPTPLYSDAALAFLWFNKSRGAFVQGLLNRRALEVLMFSQEEYH